MGLIIYVSLLLLTPEILSLSSDPQDNAFLSWAHSYAAFHNQSNCWVCGALPSSSVEGFLWWTSPLQGKDFLQVCEYLQQKSHVMMPLRLMTSNNPRMDWCNTLYLNYGHNLTFNFDYTLSQFNDYFASHKTNRSRSDVFLPDFYQIWDEVIWLTPEKGCLISTALICWNKQTHPPKLASNLITIILIVLFLLFAPCVCNCVTGFVSSRMKAFKLQMVVQAPMTATSSSKYYLGPLDQRPSL